MIRTMTLRPRAGTHCALCGEFVTAATAVLPLAKGRRGRGLYLHPECARRAADLLLDGALRAAADGPGAPPGPPFGRTWPWERLLPPTADN